MSAIIFCPNCDALILDAARCPACGKWERPPAPPAGRGAVIWGATLPARLDSSLTLAGGVLYAGDAGGSLHALDAATGKPHWPRPVALGAWRVYRQVAVGDGLVVVGPRDAETIPAADKAVLALDAATGQERWRRPLAARQVSDPLVAGDSVYLSTSDGQALALALADGALRWQASNADVCKAAPTAAGGLILFGGDKGALSARRAVDGQLAWRFQAPAGGPWGNDFPYPVICAGGVIYATCWNNCCYALDAATGELRWTSEACKRPPMTPPRVTADAVYFCAHDRYVYSLDSGTGVRRWLTQLPARSQTTPVVLDGSVYVLAQDHKLYALDAASGRLSGEPLLETARHVDADWVCDGERVFAGDAGGQLYAVAVAAPTVRATPEALAGQGKWAEAAPRYALAGDLVRAAEIYCTELNEPRHAARLFERGGDKLRAAAEFERAGDRKLARVLYGEVGRHEDMIRLSLVLGDLQTAALAYEKVNRWDEAADLYLRLGQVELPQAAHAFERAAEKAAQQGAVSAAQERWIKAAEAYEKLSQGEKAVQLYQRAGQENRADRLIREERDPALQVRLLRMIAPSKELARLLHELGQFAAAAEVFMRLKRPSDAGQMYEQGREYVLAAEQFKLAEQWGDAGRMLEATGALSEAATLYLRANDRPKAAAMYARQSRWLDAAQLYEELNDWSAAARAWVTAGELNRAAEAWEHGGELVQAAAAWRHLGACDRSAEDYWQAAQTAQAQKEPSGTAREAVAALYDLAMQGFEDCGWLQRVEECDAIRRFLRRQPLLTLKPSFFSAFTEGHSGKLQVTVKNAGWGQAWEISFQVAGAFEIDLEQAAKPFSLAPDVSKDVPIYVVPRRAGSPLPLRLTVNYLDAHRQGVPPIERFFEITVRSKDERRGDSTPIIVTEGGKIIQMGSGDYVEDGQVKIERHAPAITPVTPPHTPLPGDTSAEPVETRQVTCANCGTEQRADRFKCVKCGMPFVRCTACGRALPARGSFCQHCGATQM